MAVKPQIVDEQRRGRRRAAAVAGVGATRGRDAFGAGRYIRSRRAGLVGLMGLTGLMGLVGLVDILGVCWRSGRHHPAALFRMLPRSRAE
jgi:hypothetical protein